VGRQVRKEGRAKAAESRGRRPKPGAIGEEENILRESTKYLIRKVGGLLVATGLREEQHQGSRRWIITVTLRDPTGHEGYVGDLLYDGKAFSVLTPNEVMNHRARQIEADPEGIRAWNEYRTSPLPTRKA
jgi:hypothetical protein